MEWSGEGGEPALTRAEQFERLRPLLFAIAYRMLGSVSEAEDAVQETWLRFHALREGDVDGLRELLAADVQMVGDAGGRAPQWKPITGVENVARVLTSIFPLFVQIGGAVEPREVNGHPGAIFRDRDGSVVTTWTIDVVAGHIQTIHAVLNPDKLAHVGPVADAWALIRETAQARHPTETPSATGPHVP